MFPRVSLRGAVIGSSLVIGISASFAAFRSENWKVIAWNDLGMHCMDGDYSVFSLLPPFNTLQAHVITPKGKRLTSDSGVVVTYEAVADPRGSRNSTSVGKTNFWHFAKDLYGGSSTPDKGLAGHDMPGPSNTPQKMKFDAATSMFVAEGIPIAPYDDHGHIRRYPMMRVVVRDRGGKKLAETSVVLPVSDEMDCSACHASGSKTPAKPRAGWVYDRDAERDFRLNILLLHDERQARDPVYQAALKKAGYAPGLYDTATKHGRPILCAKCHKTNALPGLGDPTVSSLTSALHQYHAFVTDPKSGKKLDDLSNRAACYMCHPGSETRCLRGAMGAAVDSKPELSMQCQSCHGNMSAVGKWSREGWLDQPSCQNCHTGTATKNSGQIRYTSVFDASGKRRVAADATFATNKDVPAKGFDLYRFSKGHGGLRCEACHGSTHAVYPSVHENDNVQSEALQGHVGTIAECSACHKETPEVGLEGPHGLHPIGQKWVDWHADAARKYGIAACAACHGKDLRSTVLSRMHADRTLTSKFGAKKFFRGAEVTCYACHKGPNSNKRNPNQAPVVQNAQGKTTSKTIKITLVGRDPDNNPLSYRVVSQPHSGLVSVAGNVATYKPLAGFAGKDSFAFAAFDGAIESNLGTVTVERGPDTQSYGSGYPGTGGVVPVMTPTADPRIGTTTYLRVVNTSGRASGFLFVMGSEAAVFRTQFGGRVLAEPLIAWASGLPASGLRVPLPIPNLTAAVGLRLHAQAIQFDPGARFGWAFTPGLRLIIGR